MLDFCCQITDTPLVCISVENKLVVASDGGSGSGASTGICNHHGGIGIVGGVASGASVPDVGANVAKLSNLDYAGLLPHSATNRTH